MNKLDLLEKFYEFSELVGKDPLLVQGAGGNTSIKIDKKLKIKASGKLLSRVFEENIFIDLDLNEIRLQYTNDNDLDFPVNAFNMLRPSIETSFHALLPNKIIFHLHCINSISWLVQKDYLEYFNQYLKDIRWISIPYCKPGISLGKKILAKLNGDKVDIIFLENHGVIYLAENFSELKKNIRKVTKILKRPRLNHQEVNFDLLKVLSLGTEFILPENNDIHQLALTETFLQVASGGVLYPDHVVFLGSELKTAKNKIEILKIQESSYKGFIVIPKLGVLIHKNISNTASEMVTAFYEVISRIPKNSEIKYIPDNDVDELINWESEKFRLKQQN